MTDHYADQREADEIWKNAPIGATHYGGGYFWRMHDSGNVWETYRASQWFLTGENPLNFGDYCERPQTKPKGSTIAQAALKPQGPYQRTIICLDGSKCVADVYRVLEAFEVDSHAIAHSIKKLLVPGKRHAKSREQDLREAIASIEAELLLMEQRNV